MGLVNSFEIGKNFWSVNPQLQLMGAFKKLYDADKTKGKEESSNIMWAISLVYDTESKYYNLPIKDRLRITAIDFLHDAKFPWKQYDEQVSFFQEVCLTEAERTLSEWNQKMLERSKFIKATKYTIGVLDSKGKYVGGTATIIDGMMANTKKLYDQYRQVCEDLAKEKGKGRTYGGASESATEKGLI